MSWWQAAAGIGALFGGLGSLRRPRQPPPPDPRPWFVQGGISAYEDTDAVREGLGIPTIGESGERPGLSDFDQYRIRDETLAGDALRQGAAVEEQNLGFAERYGEIGFELEQRSADAGIDRLTALGLTPQEIAGAGGAGAGGAGSGGGNVIGNGPDIAAAQQATTARQVEASRSATAIATAEINAAAQVESARVGAGASIAASGIGSLPAHRQAGVVERLAPVQEQQINATIESLLSRADFDVQQAYRAQDEAALAVSRMNQVLQQTGIDQQLFEERWQRMFSTMGPENVITSALAVKHGLDLEAVLKAAPDVDVDALERFITQAVATKSLFGRETSGVGEFLAHVFGVGETPDNPAAAQGTLPRFGRQSGASRGRANRRRRKTLLDRPGNVQRALRPNPYR